MKIRNGFVSNSSSSSFLVVLPNDLDLKEFIISKKEDIKETISSDHGECDDNQLDVIIDKVYKAVIDNNVWVDNFDYSDDYNIYNIIDYLFGSYSIASFETGSDSGEIQFISEEKLLEKLNNFK
jgi:hypothetical protein